MIQPDLRTRASWGDRPDRPRMRLLSWKPMRKGTLRGFATVELPIGLRIFDCPVLTAKNGPWAVLPSKPVLDADGQHVKPGGRKGQYAPVRKWPE